MELHLRGPALLITVGPAASGKSTLLRRLRADGVVDEVVSTDAVRAELGLPAAETERTYAETRRRVSSGLAAGRVIAADATNLRPSDRHGWRRVARAASASLAAVRIGADLTLDDLLARDAGRDRHVPADAIREHLERFATTASAEVLSSEGLVFVDAGRPIVRCPAGCTSHGADVAVVDRLPTPVASPAPAPAPA